MVFVASYNSERDGVLFGHDTIIKFTHSFSDIHPGRALAEQCVSYREVVIPHTLRKVTHHVVNSRVQYWRHQ